MGLEIFIFLAVQTHVIQLPTKMEIFPQGLSHCLWLLAILNYV